VELHVRIRLNPPATAAIAMLIAMLIKALVGF
jgi:hypothetical protein